MFLAPLPPAPSTERRVPGWRRERALGSPPTATPALTVTLPPPRCRGLSSPGCDALARPRLSRSPGPESVSPTTAEACRGQGPVSLLFTAASPGPGTWRRLSQYLPNAGERRQRPAGAGPRQGLEQGAAVPLLGARDCRVTPRVPPAGRVS